MFLNPIYSYLPIWAQNCAISVVGAKVRMKRLGAQFVNELAMEEKRLEWSRTELDEFRCRLLVRLLRSGYETEFWKSRFDRYGVNHSASDPFSELSKLPVLGKDEVRRHLTAMVNPTLGVAVRRGKTSGSTGTPLEIVEAISCEAIRWATWWRNWRSLGIDFGTRHGSFGAQLIVPFSQRRSPYWRYDRGLNRILFSSFHLSRTTALEYFDEIQSEQLTWLHGFPSTLALFAGYCLELGLGKIPSLRIITTGAENLMDHQKHVIEMAFGVPVFTHYCMAESVANFSQDKNGDYFVDEDFAHTEFVSSEKEPNVYRIIGTNLHNPVMPMFRYDTGDLAFIDGSVVYQGWASRKVDRVDGRADDYVLLSDGRSIGRLSTVFRGLNSVRAAQIHQWRLGEVEVRLICDNRVLHKQDEAAIRANFRSRFGDDMLITISICDELEVTRTGKTRLVVSHLG